MNLTTLTPSIGKLVRETEFFSLGMATGVREGIF